MGRGQRARANRRGRVNVQVGVGYSEDLLPADRGAKWLYEKMAGFWGRILVGWRHSLKVAPTLGSARQILGCGGVAKL